MPRSTYSWPIYLGSTQIPMDDSLKHNHCDATSATYSISIIGERWGETISHLGGGIQLDVQPGFAMLHMFTSLDSYQTLPTTFQTFRIPNKIPRVVPANSFQNWIPSLGN